MLETPPVVSAEAEQLCSVEVHERLSLVSSLRAHELGHCARFLYLLHTFDGRKGIPMVGAGPLHLSAMINFSK